MVYLDVLVSFFGSEGARIAEEINKADGNATIDVEDELQDHPSVQIDRMQGEKRTVSFFDVVTFSTARA